MILLTDPASKWVAVYRIIVLTMLLGAIWLGLINKQSNDTMVAVIPTIVPLTPTPTP